MLRQVVLLQPESVDRRDHRLDDGGEPGGRLLQVLVERVFQQVVVQVSDQVDEALLLRALDRVVGRVEVGDQDTLEPGQGLLRGRSVPGRGVDVHRRVGAGEDPDVRVPYRPHHPHLGLVGMDQGTRP